MKTKSKSHVLIMAAIAAVLIAGIWSCNKNDDPSLSELREDKLQYLEDSLRISDSLKRINQAGIVNYAISVVNGSTSTIYSNATGPGRENQTANVVDGATVTISQYGKTLQATTDASGMVVFNGFFRSSVNVTIQKTGFTTVSYISAVNLNTSTSNGTINFIGNIIPVFETAGNNTATISGKATIQTNLTNKTRELVPDGTKVSASIDAKNASFGTKFLTDPSIKNVFDPGSTCGCKILTIGEILQASYQTGVVGTVTGGNYSLTVPAAIDGLPIALEYSEIAADQTLFESTNAAGQRTMTYRTIFQPTSSAANLPNSASVGVTFETYSIAATATASILAGSGALHAIEVTNPGNGYTVPPVVVIESTTGTGAQATANIANGRVISITLTNGGSGYSGGTTVTLRAGKGAAASTQLAADGTITGISMNNSGFGYTAPPIVTIAAPPTGTQATATATIDASGRVTISMNNFGSGYISTPAVTIGAPPAGGVQATATAVWSGNSVGAVNITANGQYYSAATPPPVTFSLPERVNGVRAQGTAVVDATTGQISKINLTSAGSGYLVPPSVTIQSVAVDASASAVLSGGSVTGIDITNAGADYTGTPNVIFTKVTSSDVGGATGTAVMLNGRVVGVNITNGGGYTTAPTVSFSAGDGAVGYATVANGAITGVTITDGGRNFTGAPRVVFTSSDGAGATATATVANGAVATVAIGAGGSGYLEGNTPPGTVIAPGPPPVLAGEGFSATKGTSLTAKTGVTYINDLYYGTGTVRNPN